MAPDTRTARLQARFIYVDYLPCVAAVFNLKCGAGALAEATNFSLVSPERIDDAHATVRRSDGTEKRPKKERTEMTGSPFPVDITHRHVLWPLLVRAPGRSLDQQQDAPQRPVRLRPARRLGRPYQ